MSFLALWKKKRRFGSTIEQFLENNFLLLFKNRRCFQFSKIVFHLMKIKDPINLFKDIFLYFLRIVFYIYKRWLRLDRMVKDICMLEEFPRLQVQTRGVITNWQPCLILSKHVIIVSKNTNVNSGANELWLSNCLRNAFG